MSAILCVENRATRRSTMFNIPLLLVSANDLESSAVIRKIRSEFSERVVLKCSVSQADQSFS